MKPLRSKVIKKADTMADKNVVVAVNSKLCFVVADVIARPITFCTEVNIKGYNKSYLFAVQIIQVYYRGVSEGD